MIGLEEIRPPGRISRVGRWPDPWAWPPWEAQHLDGTFGNRWDDPEGVYRVLYACTQLEGAFVPADWLQRRAIGEATAEGRFADVGHARSLVYLRSVMAARLIHFELSDVDAAALRLSAPRRFTQEISNHIYKLSMGDGTPRFAGIEYESRLGDDYQNWALFERPSRPPIASSAVRPVTSDAPGLRAALTMLQLKLG